MAFESITRELLSRADEARDPGSGDAYLRIDHAGETTLKLSGICLLSEAVYRSGSEPAKNMIAAMMAGRAGGWASVVEIAGRLPREHALVRRLTEPPSNAERLHELCGLMLPHRPSASEVASGRGRRGTPGKGEPPGCGGSRSMDCGRLGPKRAGRQ